MVTIKDIAKEAGVSRGTVDRVLHNRGKVAPEKAAEIRRIADELGYQPNIAGRGLAARKKHIKLGFIYIQSENTPFHTVICESARQYAEELQQYGVEVEFFALRYEEYGGDTSEWSKHVRTIMGRQEIDGWAIVGSLVGRLMTIPQDGEKAIDKPIVLYNMDEQIPNKLAYVGCDYIQSGRLACGVAALMTRNRAHVGIVSLDDGGMPSSAERIAGFEAEIRDRYPQIQIVSKIFAGLKLERDELFTKVHRMLKEHQDIDVLYLVNPGDYSICQTVRRTEETQDVRIITNDLVTDWQQEMVRNGTIDAAICQEPEKQGVKPLEILFNYLALGMEPESTWYKTELSVRIGQNV